MMRHSLQIVMLCAVAGAMLPAAAQTPPVTPVTPVTPAPASPAVPPPAMPPVQSPAPEQIPQPTPPVPPVEPAQPAPEVVPALPPMSVVPEVAPLVKTDTRVGTGKQAVAGSKVYVHYTGWLYTGDAKRPRGRKFDSSIDRGEPLSFILGSGRVIKGWDQGLDGMKVGGKRTLIIPSHMAYGERGAGTVIKPGADLIFDVQLVNVK